MNVCEEFHVHKQRRRGVVRGVPYPGGVGGPRLGRPRTVVAYASRPFFPSVREAYRRDGSFLKKRWRFLGTFGGFPRSSPRGRLGFAEGKARRTSVFVRIRAFEGPEGSQK